MSPPLLDEVRCLLRLAETAIAEPRLAAALRRCRERLDDPLRVAIAGRVKTGKSTLLNALVGEHVAATDAAECTRYVTTYQDGPSYRAFVVDRAGDEHQVGYSPSTATVDVSDFTPSDIDRLRVEFPSPHLREVHLIDTPGLSSLTADASNRTRDLLLAPSGVVDADAVIYLMRHLHRDDQRFLEAFAEPDHIDASAVNAIALVSRADEIGGGRTDALDIAGRIAEDYRREPAVRARAFAVRPIAALLALSASTLTQGTYDQLDRLASLPADVLDRALLGVDAFADAPIPTLSSDERAQLLDRLGLMGLRMAVELIIQGLAPTASALADSLLERSGLAGMQALFLGVFSQRRHVLRARAAVNLVEASLATASGDHAELRRELDRVRTDAHELVELRLLEERRVAPHTGGGRVRPPDPALEDEIERLIGAGGATLTTRLGLPEHTPAAQVRRAILDTHRRWRTIAASPAAGSELARAAQVVVRSLEVGLARLADDAAGEAVAR